MIQACVVPMTQDPKYLLTLETDEASLRLLKAMVRNPVNPDESFAESNLRRALFEAITKAGF